MDTVISKFASWVLILAGVFNLVIWPRFARAIIADPRSWLGSAWHSQPTPFLWVHAALIISATLVAVCVLVIGIQALRRR